MTQAPAAVGVASVVVTDSRGEDGHYIGTIRGGFGNPLKTIRSAGTTADAVRDAIRTALQARGWSAATGDILVVDLTRFDVDQMARREAHAEFRVTLKNAAGQVVYQDAVQAEDINGSIISLSTGVFASPDDLSALMVQTMNEAIDRMLDKPGFRAALGG